MRPAKTIDIKLNGIYDVSFTLEFDTDKDGKEIVGELWNVCSIEI